MRVRVKFGGGCERIIPQISYEARFTGRETGGGGQSGHAVITPLLASSLESKCTVSRH